MDLLDRITKDPQILAGKPTIRGMRISVELVMERLNSGVWTEEDILNGYPGLLTPEDIEACRLYAATGASLTNVVWSEFMDRFDEAVRQDAEKLRKSQQA